MRCFLINSSGLPHCGFLVDCAVFCVNSSVRLPSWSSQRHTCTSVMWHVPLSSLLLAAALSAKHPQKRSLCQSSPTPTKRQGIDNDLGVVRVRYGIPENDNGTSTDQRSSKCNVKFKILRRRVLARRKKRFRFNRRRRRTIPCKRSP